MNVNQEKIFVDFGSNGGEDYNNYLKTVYSFLKSKSFTHLGTRGDVLVSDGINTTYEFKSEFRDASWHDYSPTISDFAPQEDINDHIFVYGNANPSISGDVSCYILFFDYVDRSTIFADGEKYTYDVIISLYAESSKENYSFPSYGITYQTETFFMSDCPTQAMAGVEVKIKTFPLMDADLALFANGVEMEQTHADSDFWEYTFTMPYEDVYITYVVTDGGPLPPEPDTTGLLYLKK